MMASTFLGHSYFRSSRRLHRYKYSKICSWNPILLQLHSRASTHWIFISKPDHSRHLSAMPPITFFIEQFTSIPNAPEGDLLKGKNVIITGANTGEHHQPSHLSIRTSGSFNGPVRLNVPGEDAETDDPA